MNPSDVLLKWRLDAQGRQFILYSSSDEPGRVPLFTRGSLESRSNLHAIVAEGLNPKDLRFS